MLDSSVVLAVILGEPGAALVEALLPGAKVSAVNVGGVAAKLCDWGMPQPTVETVLGGLQIDAAGLSLGGCGCLALAAALGCLR